MTIKSVSQQLLIFGTVLFLLGLLNGALVQAFHNPRMGLSAHLAAVQNAIVLWAFGLMGPRAVLSERAQVFTVWSAVYGMYAIWLGLVVAGVFGASRSLPIAGQGYSASNVWEAIVTVLVYSGSLAIISATLVLLLGLIRGLSDNNLSQPA